MWLLDRRRGRPTGDLGDAPPSVEVLTEAGVGATGSGGGGGGGSRRRVELVPGHAYAVLQVEEVGGVPMVEVRQPVGACAPRVRYLRCILPKRCPRCLRCLRHLRYLRYLRYLHYLRDLRYARDRCATHGGGWARRGGDCRERGSHAWGLSPFWQKPLLLAPHRAVG